MTFASPELLWLLLAPVALLVWELTHRRRTAATSRPKILRAEAGAQSLRLSSPDAPHSTRAAASRVRYWLLAGTSLVLVALARPQYGRLEEPVFDQSREILLAIDLSRSMLAPDVKPSRLERGKLLIQSLLEKLEGERVGLVVFSGTAFLQSPLSADYEILREFLPALNPDFLPQGGTNYGALLDASIQAFSATNSADRFLVILSDGEATDEDWKGRIDELKKKNIRILGLGVGTSGGAMIPDGSGGFAKDERGAVVLSKLESATLQELSTATGGVYRDASGWLDLAGLIKETVEAGRKGQFLEKNTIRLAERFQWPLALGVWCLLVSFYREFPVRPKPRDIKLTPHAKAATTPAPSTVPPIVASLLLAVFLASPAPSFAIIPPAGAPTAKSATPSNPAAASAPAAPPAAEALSKIVGRLATSPAPAARDWAELGRETVTWGSKLQSEQQTIPEGPVRDALAAVDVGSKLDAKTADWPKLREELEALLKKSEEQKQDQQKKQDDQNKQDQQNKDQDQQNQDQQNKDQQKQDQKKSDQKQSKDQKDQQSQEKQDQQQKQDQQDAKPDDQQKQGDSAFGDMKDKQPPPPPPPQPDPGTQKVGGQPERKPVEQQAPDPSLALPLQKLEQLRNQDSPAHLFQLMEGEKKPAPKTKGKDW